MNNLESVPYPDQDRWRLDLVISDKRFQAILANNAEESATKVLADETFANPDEALARIEAIVYDNPAILDDYRTAITIETPRQVWIPSDEEDADYAEERAIDTFCELYDADPNDVLLDPIPGYFNVYSPMEGLASFLARTFSGAKIRHRLSNYAELPLQDDAIRCHITDGNSYIIAKKDGKLWIAAVHATPTPEDALYFITLTQEYLALENPELIIEGPEDFKAAILKHLNP